MKKILSIIITFLFILQGGIITFTYASNTKSSTIITESTQSKTLLNNYLESGITDPISKKVILKLLKKKDYYLKKYGKKEGYAKFINLLVRINNVINKIKEYRKYLKYKKILTSLYVNIKVFIEVMKEIDRVENNKQINSSNQEGNNNISTNNTNNIQSNDNLNSNYNTENTTYTDNSTDFTNMPEVKLYKGITNNSKIAELMKKDFTSYNTKGYVIKNNNNTISDILNNNQSSSVKKEKQSNPSYDKAWKKIEEKYPQSIKNFIKYVNNVSKLTKKDLENDSEFVLEKIANESKKTFKVNNKQLDFKLPEINKQALKKTIENIENGEIFLNETDYNNILKQSEKAVNNNKRIIQSVLNTLTNKLILLYETDNEGMYFGKDLKIRILRGTNCVYNGGDFRNNSEGIKKIVFSASNYSSKYFTFAHYYNANKNIELILYKKTPECFNKVTNSFKISLLEKNNKIEKKIFAKLGAKYLLNIYNFLILVNNKVYLIYRPGKMLHTKKSVSMFSKKDFNEEFLYLGEIDLFKKNLYYFYFIIDKFYNFLTDKKLYDENGDNLTVKIIEKNQKNYSNFFLNLYKIIYNNNFKTIKDIYKYIGTNYNYDRELYKKLANKNSPTYKKTLYKIYNLESFINKKQGLCDQISGLLSIITSFYGIPSGGIVIKSKEGHAISLINGNIYDPTWDVSNKSSGLYKGFGNTFENVKDIVITYPSDLLDKINKDNKIFKGKIFYSKFREYDFGN